MVIIVQKNSEDVDSQVVVGSSLLPQSTSSSPTAISSKASEQSSLLADAHLSWFNPNAITERSAAYKQRIDSLFGTNGLILPEQDVIVSTEISIDTNLGSNGSTQVIESSDPYESLLQAEPMGFRKQVICVNGNDNVTVVKNDPEVNMGWEENQKREVTEGVSPRTRLSGFSDSLSSLIGDCAEVAASPYSSFHKISSIRISGEESSESSSTDLLRGLTSTEMEAWTQGTEGGCISRGFPSGNTFHMIKSLPKGILSFPVEYLGSVPVKGSTTTLNDLQSPLKSLYENFLENNNIIPGHLSITSNGLKFEGSKLRLVNPFSTIAVWAAVKFVARGDPICNECAFMPLISDPEGQDKDRLFSAMTEQLQTAYCVCCVNSNSSFKNPPVFACVMREASFSLDCHAFVCKCSEDAIVIAANLYQSLVDKMRNGKEGESGYGSLNRITPPTQQSSSDRTGSSASSHGTSSQLHNKGNASFIEPCKDTRKPRSAHRVVFSDSESIIPVRPPRKKKRNHDILIGHLKRCNSDESLLLKTPHKRKYLKSSRQVSKSSSKLGGSKMKKRVKITTPEETSSESFNDSIDHIIDQIVNPSGMSFNDLKPAYQELILKIALTLTRDQMYQKSKRAMRKQQQQLQIRGKHKSVSTTSAESSDENSQFLHQVLKSFSKMKKNGHISTKNNASSELFNPTRYSHLQYLPAPVKSGKLGSKELAEDEAPFMSFCSGCLCDKCSEKCYCSLPTRRKGVGKDFPHESNDMKQTKVSKTCFTPPKAPKGCSGDNGKCKSKKPCGYDTDSCAESEKCYCSLQRVKSNGLKIYNINLDTETSDTDTNSYDFEPLMNNEGETNGSVSNMKTISARSIEILSYNPSRNTCNSACSSPLSSPNGRATPLRSTNALVHFDERPINHKMYLPPKSYHLDSNDSVENEFNASKNHFQGCSIQGPGIDKRKKADKTCQIKTNCDVKDFAKSKFYKQRSPRGRLCPENDSERAVIRRSPKFTSIEDVDHEHVQSMKKTAEIAAMFSEMKINRQCITPSEYHSGDNSAQEINPSLDFEASLGYLP